MKTATFDRFDIEMPNEAVDDCHHQGTCDEDVQYWQSHLDLSHISDEDLAAELKEYGAWSVEELADRQANELRIIWIAAGNIQEDERT